MFVLDNYGQLALSKFALLLLRRVEVLRVARASVLGTMALTYRGARLCPGPVLRAEKKPKQDTLNADTINVG